MIHEGLLVVISAPSGTGKGTLLKELLQRNENVKLSISATTRKPRESEVDGKNYFFRTVDEFKSMIENDELIEWDEYCGNFYGTPKKYITDTVSEGYDVILEITVEGAINIKNKYDNSVLIFIMPPSFEELKRRIEGRGTECVEIIEKRLQEAKEEIKHINKYDYIVVNDNLEKAINDINCILTSEKLKYERNKEIISNSWNQTGG